MTPLEPRIKAQAYGLGFDLCGIATLGPAPTAAHFDRWLERGFAGEMYYLKRWADRRRDTRRPARGMTLGDRRRARLRRPRSPRDRSPATPAAATTTPS